MRVDRQEDPCNCLLVTSAKRLNWTKNGKKVRRFEGPAPDDQLQPIRGLPPRKNTVKTLKTLETTA